MLIPMPINSNRHRFEHDGKPGPHGNVVVGGILEEDPSCWTAHRDQLRKVVKVHLAGFYFLKKSKRPIRARRNAAARMMLGASDDVYIMRVPGYEFL
jgi:hypothetical protein